MFCIARVFVSSTFKDLEEYRKKVSLVLRQMGHEDVAMEYFVAEDKKPLDKCLEAVDSSDLYVGIFAWRYGDRPNGYDKSFTELEYREAVRCEKECLIFLLDKSAPWPRDLMDEGDDDLKIKELRKEFSINHVVSYFKSSEDLATKVGNAIHCWGLDERNSLIEFQSIPETDMQLYKSAIAVKYCNIDIDTLTPSKRDEFIRIKLANVFVEQNVRASLPPVELPKEILKQIADESRAKDFDPSKRDFPAWIPIEDIENAKKSYYSKDLLSVFETITDEDKKCIVILGDPGSGKSTLARYILLSTLNIFNDIRLNKFDGYLPFLIELRKFSVLRSKGKCSKFIDYLYFMNDINEYNLPPRETIQKYLENTGKSIFIFDGLDEIFDPSEWEETVEMIVGFKIRYPKVHVIVTSRIIGYRSRFLEDAGFVHFTLQDFEKEQIEAFLDKWYSVVFDNREEIEERKIRILKSLQESNSIKELAGNPLLLTILAVIGKRQELPRERWRLYEHASGVLIEHWDVNKHLNDSKINMAYIGEAEKRELLMAIASKIQSNSSKSSANFIHRDELVDEIGKYVENRYKKDDSESRDIARQMIDQLRKRNFILSLYGGEIFGFVHRTFLEYFCAMNIVTKFDNHELNIESLQENYYIKYWEDPKWYEVLRLVCGMKEKFASNIIDCLIKVYEPKWIVNRPPVNIVLAIKCMCDVRITILNDEVKEKLFMNIFKLFETARWTRDLYPFLADEIVPSIRMIDTNLPSIGPFINNVLTRNRIYMNYKGTIYQEFRKSYEYSDLNNIWAELVKAVSQNSETIYETLLKKADAAGRSKLLAILILGQNTHKTGDLFPIFLKIAKKERNDNVRLVAVQKLAISWSDTPEAYEILKQKALDDPSEAIRHVAVQELASIWSYEPKTIELLKQKIYEDSDSDVRIAALQGLIKSSAKYTFVQNIVNVKNIVEDRAVYDKSDAVRVIAVKEFSRVWPEDYSFLESEIYNDWSWNVREAAVKGFSRVCTDKNRVSQLLIYVAKGDANGNVRATAIEELSISGAHDIILEFLRNSGNVSVTAIEELSRSGSRSDIILEFLRIYVDDPSGPVRAVVIQEIARLCPDDSETLSFIKQKICIDDSWYVRRTAFEELVKGWPNDPQTFKFIKEKVMNDNNYHDDLKMIGIQVLAKLFPDKPETVQIIKKQICESSNWVVKATAIEELSRCWYHDPSTLIIIKHSALKDRDKTVRFAAIQELAKIWHDDPETKKILYRAIKDDEKKVRIIAVQELAQGWYDDPGVFKILKGRAYKDTSLDVKIAAIQELAQGWHNDPNTLKILKDLVFKDTNWNVRMFVVQELAQNWYDDPDTLRILKNRACKDTSWDVKIAALKEIVLGWHDDPSTFKILKYKAVNDEHWDVRKFALEKLSNVWYDNPETMQILQDRSLNDENASVRYLAYQELNKLNGKGK